MSKSNTKELFLSKNDLDKCRKTIKELLFKNNINISELAKSINVPQPTIQRLVAGTTLDPKLSTLTIIANYFSLTIDQLLGNYPISVLNSDFSYKVHTAPIISWQHATQYKNFFENEEIKEWKEWLAVDIDIHSKLVFGLKTKPSMEPRFITGSILTIDPGKDPVDGDLVIVHYKDTLETTIREIILDGPKHEVCSITNQSTEALTGNIKLIGVVVQIRFSY